MSKQAAELQKQVEELEAEAAKLEEEQKAIPGHIAAAVAANDRKTVKALRERQEDLADDIYSVHVEMLQAKLAHVNAHRAEQSQRLEELKPKIEERQQQIAALEEELKPLIAERASLNSNEQTTRDRKFRIQRTLDALIAEETRRIQALTAPTMRALNV